MAQVQGTDGQWREEPEWPTTGGPVGHLALGEGTLGVAAPSGSTTFREGLPFHDESPIQNPSGFQAVWESGPLPGRLQMTGQPVLDLWVRLDQPDAHLAAELETFDAAGEPIPGGSVLGFRSMRHLDPLPRNNRFAQERGRPAPVDTPIRVLLRFNPGDLVVPTGGRVRVTIAGAEGDSTGLEGAFVPSPVVIFGGPSWPSLSFTTVTILHDCEHPSALRFVMPRKRPQLLNVREKDEKGPLRGVSGPLPSSDAAGLAAAPVCGKGPIRLPMFGPASRY